MRLTHREGLQILAFHPVWHETHLQGERSEEVIVSSRVNRATL